MTREADLSIPTGATWVDYTPYVTGILEHNAQRGWRVVVYFYAFGTMYLFDLSRMIQVNQRTGRQRPIRRLTVTHAAPVAARL
jgi:hypothetical protein